MGQAKKMMMEYEGRGYGSTDKLACDSCIGDTTLKKFVIKNGTQDTCDFCNKKAICISVEELLSEIMDGIYTEYEYAANSMGWENGEYVGAQTWDTYDLISDLQDEFQLQDDLCEEVRQTIRFEIWCEKDPYWLRENQEQLYLWERFCAMVKKETRYVFFRLHEEDEYDDRPPFMILDYIGDTVTQLNLIIQINPNFKFIRGRMNSMAGEFKTVKKLTSPPHEYAKSNRMSAESRYSCA